MISHSPIRHLHLFRFRMRFIVLTALISGCGSAVVGLMAPYLYTSSATVQIDVGKTQKRSASYIDDSVEFHKAALLIQSPQILSQVAAKLVARPLDIRYYFPRSLSAFDMSARLSLMLRHMGYRPPPVQGGLRLDQDVVTSLLATHIQVSPDYRIHTILVSYEAGSPDIAREICAEIIAEFVDLSNSIEKEELRRQEKYLLESIDRQLGSIRRIEQGMEGIVEAHPSMTSAQREQGRGATLAAQRLLDKRDRLQNIEQEIHSNERILTNIRNDLARANTLRTTVQGDVTAKVVEEISQLEFRRIQSIKVTGYPENHPAVLNLTRRINDLKQILTNLSRDGRQLAAKGQGPAEGTDVKSLYSQAGDFRAKNRSLVAERDALVKDLGREDELFRKAVKVNFRFDALVRELNSDLTVTNELYRELQKTRIALAGSTPAVSMISPASFNPHAINLSINRRTVFGLFVGIAFAMSLLILLEIIRPTLLLPEDLEHVKLSHLGTFGLTPRALSQVAYCVRSLERAPGKPPGNQVVTFLSFATGFDVSEFIAGVASALAERGARVGAVLIVDPDAPATAEQESLWAASNVAVTWISRDEVPFFLAPTVEELKKKWDWVLVVDTNRGVVPMEAYFARCSDHFLYLTQVGDTDLTSVDRVRHLPQLPAHIHHHSVIVDVPRPSASGGWSAFRRKWRKAA